MDMVVITLIVLVVLGALFIIPRSHKKGKAKGTSSNVHMKTQVLFDEAKALCDHGDMALRSYTKEEVSLHNTRKDCWIIIKGKVYDVTPYVEEHPGGDAILNNAGGDSTEGFYGPQHATRVFDMVDEFYIGDLNP